LKSLFEPHRGILVNFDLLINYGQKWVWKMQFTAQWVKIKGLEVIGGFDKDSKVKISKGLGSVA